MQALFTQKKQHSRTVWSFDFTPTASLLWQAGQSLRVEIPGPYGPLEHRFSIASAPSSKVVTITTRLSGSDYKDSLADLQPGDAVGLQGLEGNFIWYDAKLPHIFVAAGIGITPLHSMLAERAAQRTPLAATLLYSSREEPVVYASELKNWAAANPEFTAHFLPTRVTAAQVLAQTSAPDRLIYISGPNKMVDALGTDLIAAGITPAHILRDQFTGRLFLDG